MRNSSIHALAPGARIVLQVDPPVADHERPYVITLRGRMSVVVQPIDTTQVAVLNPTDQLSLFMFFVGPQLSLAGFPALSRFLGGL